MTPALVGTPPTAVHAPRWFAVLSRHLGLPAPRVRKVRRTKNLLIPMSDGVRLRADLWQPVGVTRAPLLVVRSPYGRAGAFGVLYGRVFAHQGFQVLIQSCRGTAGSEGRFDRPFAAEKQDGADTVRWLVDQSWYPGSFATIGGSYLGYTQLAMAEAAHGHQVAAVLQIAPTSVRDIAWPDNSFALNTALGWASQAHHDPSAQWHHLLTQKRLAKGIRAAGTSAPLGRTYQRASRSAVPFFEGWLDHPDADDPWWRGTDHHAALEVLDCPVLVQAGWLDTFLDQGIEQYQMLSRRGVPVELTIGPWTHLSFTSKGVGYTLTDAAAFLRDVMGLERRDPAPAPVRLLEIGGVAEHRIADWPPPTSTRVLHLAAEGRLVDGPAVGAAATSFRYDPDDPTPSVGGSTIDFTAGARDNTSLEARSDVRSFTSEPLIGDSSIVGSPTVDLWFGSDRPATAVFLRLCTVDAKGVSTNVTDRLVPLTGVARQADGTWHVSTSLPPTCLRVQQGSRIRLQVSSGAFPRFARHPGVDDDLASLTNYHPAQQTIHHSLARPASLTLPFNPT